MSRHGHAAAILASIALCLLLAGCGVIGSTGQETTKQEKKSPGPFDTWLTVESMQPAAKTLSPRPTLRIHFNEYLEDDSFKTYNTGSFSSGALQWGGWGDYVMTDKVLEWSARSTIPAGLDVDFQLSDAFESVTGAPIRTDDKLGEFVISGDVPTPDSTKPPAPDWSEVRSIFERHCTECHGAPTWELNPLTRESLVGERSEQVDRFLVRPYDPADSYLMQKILWDYPERRFEPQPPPWAGGEELPRRSLITIERWIAAGAN